MGSVRSWVVVTGAGASRELGADGPMPLMGDWSKALISELDGRLNGLASAIGLDSDQSPAEFEGAIGRFLRWMSVQRLHEQFLGLGSEPVGAVSHVTRSEFNQAVARQDGVIDALNTTLYDLFRTKRVDDAKAIEAWQGLLQCLGSDSRITIATTNYDASAEIAVRALGRTENTGFDRPSGRAPSLNPRGIVDKARRDASIVPVLHLHGAVGWYEVDGVVHEHYQDQRYNKTLGRPVVLYPDPDKDPTGEVSVRDLWTEFEDALRDAFGVIVLGHSLNDPVLVSALESRPEGLPMLIGVWDARTEKDGEANPEVTSWALKKFPEPINVVPLCFGPGRSLDRLRQAIEPWDRFGRNNPGWAA